MKKFLTMAMTSTLLFSSMTVNAAEVSMTAKQNADYMMSTNQDGAPNWFNGTYYSDRYADLKSAFNAHETALYNHSLQYGFNEFRLVSPVLDVAKYRAYYPDLDEAFGNNWNMYVRHYFEYGIAEGRENFTDFDANAYLSIYTDLQNAFGTDLGLATRHYIEFGYNEGREYKWPEPTYTNDNSEDNIILDGIYTDVYPEGSYRKYEIKNGVEIWSDLYDAEGNLEQESVYNSLGLLTFERNWFNGEIERTKTIVYNENGLITETCEQTNDGNVIWWEYEYDSNNRAIKSTESAIDVDGVRSVLSIEEYEYDSAGYKISEIRKAEDGIVMYYIEYTYYESGAKKTEWGRYEDGTEWYYTEYDEEGNVIVNRD